jgi:hypothetical protein
MRVCSCIYEKCNFIIALKEILMLILGTTVSY